MKNNQQELMQAYWGPGGTVDIVRAYNAKHGCDVKPWECVKCEGAFKKHPEFTARPEAYTFALTILYDDKRNEHRPVFFKDTVYGRHDGIPFKWEGVLSRQESYEHNLSWNPPTPKRTFKLNDLELPCPLKTEPCADNLNYATLCNDGQEFYFESTEDKMQWRKAFTKLLTAAMDKE